MFDIMEDKEPQDRKPLSLPKTIIGILIFIALSLFGATHPNNPLSVLIKMLLVP
jgi:hypothetical protein